jgi:hypothetical protein
MRVWVADTAVQRASAGCLRFLKLSGVALRACQLQQSSRVRGCGSDQSRIGLRKKSSYTIASLAWSAKGDPNCVS